MSRLFFAFGSGFALIAVVTGAFARPIPSNRSYCRICFKFLRLLRAIRCITRWG